MTEAQSASTFKGTTRITAALEELQGHLSCFPETEKKQAEILLAPLPRKSYSLSEIISLATLLRWLANTGKEIKSPLFVHLLLDGSEYIAPAVEKKVLSSEYLAWKKEKEAQLAQMKYDKMVENVSRSKEQRDFEDRQELKSVRTQASIALNVVAASATLFVAGYFLGNRSGGATFGIICGVAGAVFGLLVEMLLFIIRGSQIDREIEKRKRQQMQPKKKN